MATPVKTGATSGPLWSSDHAGEVAEIRKKTEATGLDPIELRDRLQAKRGLFEQLVKRGLVSPHDSPLPQIDRAIAELDGILATLDGETAETL